MGLSDGRKSFPIGLVVLIQYRSVTASQPASHVAVAITLNAKASSLKSVILCPNNAKLVGYGICIGFAPTWLRQVSPPASHDHVIESVKQGFKETEVNEAGDIDKQFRLVDKSLVNPFSRLIGLSSYLSAMSDHRSVSKTVLITITGFATCPTV